MLRSCRTAIVATSARAWTTRTSSAANRVLSSPKRLRAPITSSRSRIGNACTDEKPASIAAGANVGHRSWACAEVGVDDGHPGDEAVEARAFVVLQLEELQNLPDSLLAAMKRSLPPMVAQHQPHGGGAADVGGPHRQLVQELEEVEVVDQAVRHLDEGRPRDGSWRSS